LHAVLLLTATAACDSSTPADVTLGAEFTLAPGQSAVAGDDGLRVTFVSVTEDSRCPKDALCVWAGRVVVEVAAGSAGEKRSLEPDDTVSVEGYRLMLVRVEPYPASDAPIGPSQYRATFVVDRP